ncbi:hypothetical protein [Sphingomonas sp. CLY1604]|uniref:hypothetical protein n=1 Tax=Sphingomonas sp. CLY1604 TaxID=3457786 RepID=UPI003FD83A25
MTDANAPGDDRGSNNHELYDDAAKRPFDPDGGEDEASVTEDGSEGDLNDDRKPLNATSLSSGSQKDENRSSKADQDVASQVDADDPQKTEKLAKAGRDIDADEGAD